MPTTATIKSLPAQYDEGILIAHPASVMSFLGVDVMVQRSVIDGKVLVTIDGDHRNTRIDMNDGTVYNGPGGHTHLSDAEEKAAEEWNAGRRTVRALVEVTVDATSDFTAAELADSIRDMVFLTVREETEADPVVMEVSPIKEPARPVVQLSEQQERDLDLAERTPHAFRGVGWLSACGRLDAAGIPYTPGARFNTPKAGQ